MDVIRHQELVAESTPDQVALDAQEIARDLWPRIRPIVEEAANHAHSLAGGLGMFGFDEASRLAGVLEGLLAASPLEPKDAVRFRRLIAQIQGGLGPSSNFG
jgi:HPt (histidine-containing phosphotransfer) domain-containing protein